MPKKILVAVDLAADLAAGRPPEVAFAAELARGLDAEVVLFHAIDYVPTLLPVELPGGYPVPQLELVRDAATTKLAKVAAAMGTAKVTTLVEVGGAATAIVEAAKRLKVDLVVIGSHSHTAVARLVLGSVADRVAHTASCPVTIVREVRH